MTTGHGRVSNPVSHPWRALPSWSGYCLAHLDPTASLVQQHVHDVTATHGHEHTPKFSDHSKCDSLDLARSNTTHLRRFFVAPPHVITFLAVTINENANRHQVSSENRSMYSVPIRTRWQDDLVYPTINQIVETFVKHQVPGTKRSYLRTARVRLLEKLSTKFVQVGCHVVETQEQWDTYVTRMISRYCGLDKRLPFCLEIHSDYEWFQVESDGGQPYIDSVRDALERTALKNYNDKDYWSKKVLKRMFDEDTVRAIVAEYCTVGAQGSGKRRLSGEEADTFVDWLVLERWRLLAVMIRAKLDLKYLYNLMIDKPDITGSELPLGEDVLRTFLKGSDRSIFGLIQGGFRPINFPQPGEPKHLSVRAGELVPIHYDSSRPIGRGGSGNVYNSTIHTDYHAFSEDKNQEFALKVLNNSGISEAREEMSTWEYVATRPHDHITSFYASWSQEDRFYMLSPLADKNLRTYLEDENPSFDVETCTEWLLEQLEGLASGINHIHNVGRKGLGLISTAGFPKKIDCAYHHDLKPDNILIFARKVWKIGDFGTVKLRQLVSSGPVGASPYTSNLPAGDAQYGSPDRFLGVKPGRPYDVWSFGCILLEVLLWAFGHGGQALKEFRRKRKDEVPRKNRCTCQADTAQMSRAESTYVSAGDDEDASVPEFWYVCRTGRKHHLKPSVVKKLALVKSEAQKKCTILVTLCELVESMLKVDYRERPLASGITEQIGILRVQAEAYFTSARRKMRVSAAKAGISEAGSHLTDMSVTADTVISDRERKERVGLPSLRASPSSMARGQPILLHPAASNLSAASSGNRQLDFGIDSEISVSTDVPTPDSRDERVPASLLASRRLNSDLNESDGDPEDSKTRLKAHHSHRRKTSQIPKPIKKFDSKQPA